MSVEAPPSARPPRRRGFNLLEKFSPQRGYGPFREEDFAIIREWGFDFARLPLDYRNWSDPADWRRLDEAVLREIDQAVSWGREYGVHVSLNFHRAPGYSVNRSYREPFNLWTDAEALEACAWHWARFAERYADVPAEALSFDLLNEPAMMAPGDKRLVTMTHYAPVIDRLVDEIRAHAPARPIWVEGGLWGSLPTPARPEADVGRSLHLYAPLTLTHWRAAFIDGAEQWPEPAWPMDPGPTAREDEAWRERGVREFYGEHPVPAGMWDDAPERPWDAARLERRLRPWVDLAASGAPVHAGEFGVFHHTPHAVALAWLRDATTIFRTHGLGWALWELRGEFGVLDSGRADVRYDTWRGHRLDRAMLDVLQAG